MEADYLNLSKSHQELLKRSKRKEKGTKIESIMRDTKSSGYDVCQEPQFDSDDDYRSPDGFLYDRLVGNLRIDDQNEVLGYLERFHN